MPTPTTNSGTEMPRPPALAEAYGEMKSAGLTAVFTKWDDSLRTFFNSYTQALRLGKDTPEMTGGRVLRPSVRPVAQGGSDPRVFVQPHTVLGWTRVRWDGMNSTNPIVAAGGWPIGINYNRADPTALLEVTYRLSLVTRQQLQFIPEPRKRPITPSARSNQFDPGLNLEEPHLRVSLEPVYGSHNDCTMVVRSSQKSQWSTGSDSGWAWSHTFWLKDSDGANIRIRSVYAELL